MKRETRSPRQHVLAQTVLGLLVTGLTLATASSAYSEARPTPHELQAIATTPGPRLWYHEEEFRRDPLLRATPEHVVILHLEPGPKGRKRLRNTIPYLFTETAPYTFCIPDDEPHIRSLRLSREGTPAPIVHVPRSAGCKMRTIAAGLYQLVVEHDGGAAAGKKAFVHVPRFKGTVQVGDGQSSRFMEDLQAANAQSSFPTCDDSPFFDNDARLLFTTPDGLYVVGDSASGRIVTSPLRGDAMGFWVICHDGSGNYNLFQPGVFGPGNVFFSSGPPNTDTSLYSVGVDVDAPTAFKLTDLGNGQFTLAANFGGTLYPIVVTADGGLHWTTSGAPTTFTIVLKYYELGVVAQPLLPGEAALFQACNYDVSSKGTWVFNTNISDFGPFKVTNTNIFLDNTVASVKLGPQTIATLYANTNFGGTAQVVGQDIPCLSSTPLGVNTASSLQVTPARQFVAATDECQNCNLSGVDLSNLDLSGGQFQGSTFTSANFSNTSLQGASLDNANLNGAATILTGSNFISALLHCTNFSGADLSSATVVLSGIKPIVTTDFSCRVDLTGATFNLSSFPLTQWRYFNLSGAKVNSLTGATLSTTTSPLNLSGVLFNSTDLHGVTLDGVNLGCATAASGASVCSQLIDANLNHVSLKKGSLVNAVLQGANLDFTNLDSANLCSAHLNKSTTTSKSASLQGAYLRNVNLSQADLTGAFLKNADFYSTTATTSCLSTNCGPTKSCASAVNAVLNSATFTGAYLSGVDFSGATPQGVDFSGTFLVGANFTNANLSEDPNTGRTTSFSGAYLQGATFTNATVKDANFTNAYVSTAGATLLMQLSSANLLFTGYQPAAGKTPGCVQFTYSHATTVPGTDNTNTCPNGGAGSCGSLPWPAPQIPLPALPANCTSTTSDFNWLVPPS